MQAKILITMPDVENLHDTCVGRVFNIKGVKGREFCCNRFGYVFEVLDVEEPHQRYYRVPYYADSRLNDFINNQ